MTEYTFHLENSLKATEKIALRSFMKEFLLTKVFSKNKKGKWIDEGGNGIKYCDFLTTVYYTRAICEFNSNSSEESGKLKSLWKMDTTLSYLLRSDLELLVREWRRHNLSVNIDQSIVMSHFKALTIHALLIMKPFFEFSEKSSLGHSIKETSLRYLSDFAGQQCKDGSFSSPERAFFTARPLISLYYCKRVFGNDFRKIDINVGAAVHCLIDRIDPHCSLISSADPNFNTHIEESAIVLEALSLWRNYYPSLKAKGRHANKLKRLAQSVAQNVREPYSGSAHDLSHVVRALYIYYGSDMALCNVDFIRIFNMLFGEIRSGRILKESRMNHPFAEGFETLALIAKDHELVPKSITIFISYSSKDGVFATKLVKALRAVGMGVWLDKFDLHAGSIFPREIVVALETSHCLCIILSPHSVESRWVEREYNIFEKSGIDKIIVPILLPNLSHREIPPLYREHQYIKAKHKTHREVAKEIKKALNGQS